MDVSNAFAVVYSANGGRHKVCWTSDDVLSAVDELVAAGIAPVVFHRRGNGEGVTNINHGGGFGIQARDIHGGVRF